METVLLVLVLILTLIFCIMWVSFFLCCLRTEEQICHFLGGWGQRRVPGSAVGRGSRLVIGWWQRPHLPAEAGQPGSAHADGEMFRHWSELFRFCCILIQTATKKFDHFLCFSKFLRLFFVKFVCTSETDSLTAQTDEDRTSEPLKEESAPNYQLVIN